MTIQQLYPNTKTNKNDLNQASKNNTKSTLMKVTQAHTIAILENKLKL